MVFLENTFPVCLSGRLCWGVTKLPPSTSVPMLIANLRRFPVEIVFGLVYAMSERFLCWRKPLRQFLFTHCPLLRTWLVHQQQS
jgi:hypothetical protein